MKKAGASAGFSICLKRFICVSSALLPLPPCSARACVRLCALLRCGLPCSGRVSLRLS